MLVRYNSVCVVFDWAILCNLWGFESDFHFRVGFLPSQWPWYFRVYFSLNIPRKHTYNCIRMMLFCLFFCRLHVYTLQGLSGSSFVARACSIAHLFFAPKAGHGRLRWDHLYFFGVKLSQTYQKRGSNIPIARNLRSQNVNILYLLTSLQQKRVYTSLGSSCPTCVHQSWEEYRRIVLANMSKPYDFSLLCHGRWRTHVGQEGPKLVYTLFCCKPVKCILHDQDQ